MKFGQHLLANIAPEYGPEPYLDYAKLDDTIRLVTGEAPASVDQANRQISLTTPPPTNSKGLPTRSTTITEEAFFTLMDAELTKVESFTLQQVTDLRGQLQSVEVSLRQPEASLAEGREAVHRRADEVAENFLRLEKYVNVNFMGFHKILKKHDKHIPNNPCKAFYVTRMHSQAWVRGDYSDVVVRLSAIYSELRQDELRNRAAKPKDDSSQSFLRSTTKYWVKTEDVSRVKYTILRHLPVFLQKTSTGESDSQLTNSVYLDNDQLELYHGRLDKSPGAIALRYRWYGAAEPSTVFVERKTHHDSWTGQVSVKERFMIPEHEVQQIMNGNFPIEQKRAEMLAKLEGAGKSAPEANEEVREWEGLVREVSQVLTSKQLVPTMRTQYMRTAFQIPFDATVRVSLDTNLCMISERGYDLQDGAVWHRDSSKPLAAHEITRFPHAILEIKLELNERNATPPQWVTDLQSSGMLYEVHKFSKFLHGCATLLPEDVRAVPYWVDDASLRDSIVASGGGRILVKAPSSSGSGGGSADEADSEKGGVGPGANQIYDHLLPFGSITEDRSAATGRTSVHYNQPSSTATPSTKASTSNRKTTTTTTTTTPKVGNYSGIHLYQDAHVEDDALLAGEAEEEEGDEGCVGWLFPFCSPRTQPQEDILAPTSIQKIEPKVFFANERTFLHWLHAGVTLYTISAGILAFAQDENGASLAHWYALALLPVAMGFVLYALHVFLWRSRLIKTRYPGRWDDPGGPLFLGGLLVLVLFLNLALKIFEIVKHRREAARVGDHDDDDIDYMEF